MRRLMSASGTKRTFSDVRSMSAFGGEADMMRTSLAIIDAISC